jgi:hypothetical protein
MPLVEKHGRLLKSLTILFVFILLVGCGGGSETQPDGDTDKPDDGSCVSTTDCEIPLVCRDGKCVEDGSADGDDVACTSNFQCPLDMKCNTNLGICVPLNADGDEPVDGDVIEDGDADIDNDLEPEMEVETDGDVEQEADAEQEEEPQPDLLVYFLQPGDRGVVDGEVVVEVGVLAENPVDKIEFYAYGAKFSELTGEPWATFWQTGELEERDEIELRAVAYSGELTSAAIIVVSIDHSDPTVSILEPQDGEVLGYYDDLDISIEAADHLKLIRVKVDGTTIGSSQVEQAQDTYELSYPLAQFAPGEHTLVVEVEDRVADHAPGSASGTFKIDEDDPVFRIDGVVWSDDNPDVGTIFAETPMVFRFDDVSGLAAVNLNVTDGVRTLISTTSPLDFPYEVLDFNSLLSWPNVQYPITLTIEASATDNFGNQASASKSVTVKRLKWTYSPTYGNPGFEPAEGFKQLIGAGAGDSGNLYIPIYNELHALTADGHYRWHCTAEQVFATTPTVVEQSGGPSLIFVSTSNGKLLVAADDGDTHLCEFYEFDINLERPTPPSVTELRDQDGVLEAELYSCVRKLSDTKCYKVTATYSPAIGEQEAAITFDEIWTYTYAGKTPPASVALPRDDTFIKPLASAGNQVMLLDPANGNNSPTDDFNAGQIVQGLSAVPATKLLMACTAKTCQAYSWVLQDRGAAHAFSTGSQDMFLDSQPVNDDQGTVLFATALIRNEAVVGVVQAWTTTLTGLEGMPWEFVTEGLPGGTPAIGQSGLAYVAGQNANGNVWALDMYADEGVYQKKMLWRVKLLTEIYAPLLITPGGDLIVVGANANVHMIDIRGDAPLDSHTSWPQYQAQPSRNGYYWP